MSLFRTSNRAIAVMVSQSFIDDFGNLVKSDYLSLNAIMARYYFFNGRL